MSSRDGRSGGDPADDDVLDAVRLKELQNSAEARRFHDGARR